MTWISQACQQCKARWTAAIDRVDTASLALLLRIGSVDVTLVDTAPRAEWSQADARVYRRYLLMKLAMPALVLAVVLASAWQGHTLLSVAQLLLLMFCQLYVMLYPLGCVSRLPAGGIAFAGAVLSCAAELAATSTLGRVAGWVAGTSALMFYGLVLPMGMAAAEAVHGQAGTLSAAVKLLPTSFFVASGTALGSLLVAWGLYGAALQALRPLSLFALPALAKAGMSDIDELHQLLAVPHYRHTARIAARTRALRIGLAAMLGVVLYNSVAVAGQPLFALLTRISAMLHHALATCTPVPSAEALVVSPVPSAEALPAAWCAWAQVATAAAIPAAYLAALQGLVAAVQRVACALVPDATTQARLVFPAHTLFYVYYYMLAAGSNQASWLAFLAMVIVYNVHYVASGAGAYSAALRAARVAWTRASPLPKTSPVLPSPVAAAVDDGATFDMAALHHRASRASPAGRARPDEQGGYAQPAESPHMLPMHKMAWQGTLRLWRTAKYTVHAWVWGIQAGWRAIHGMRPVVTAPDQPAPQHGSAAALAPAQSSASLQELRVQFHFAEQDALADVCALVAVPLCVMVLAQQRDHAERLGATHGFGGVSELSLLAVFIVMVIARLGSTTITRRLLLLRLQQLPAAQLYDVVHSGKQATAAAIELGLPELQRATWIRGVRKLWAGVKRLQWMLCMARSAGSVGSPNPGYSGPGMPWETAVPTPNALLLPQYQPSQLPKFFSLTALSMRKEQAFYLCATVLAVLSCVAAPGVPLRHALTDQLQ